MAFIDSDVRAEVAELFLDAQAITIERVRNFRIAAILDKRLESSELRLLSGSYQADEKRRKAGDSVAHAERCRRSREKKKRRRESVAKALACSLAWNTSNPDKVKIAKAAWRERNREKLREDALAYYYRMKVAA